MKMRCERVSGHPDLADILSPRQFLSFGDTGVLKVGITCKIAVSVVDRNHVPETFCGMRDLFDNPIGGGDHGLSLL